MNFRGIKLVAAIVVLFILAGCDAPQEKVIKEKIIKDYLQGILIDPESARFRKVFLKKHSRADYYEGCYYINAKNKFGGYTGEKVHYFRIANGKIILHRQGIPLYEVICYIDKMRTEYTQSDFEEKLIHMLKEADNEGKEFLDVLAGDVYRKSFVLNEHSYFALSKSSNNPITKALISKICRAMWKIWKEQGADHNRVLSFSKPGYGESPSVKIRFKTSK